MLQKQRIFIREMIHIFLRISKKCNEYLKVNKYTSSKKGKNEIWLNRNDLINLGRVL